MYAAVGKSIPTGMWNNTVCTQQQWVILYLNNTWNNMYAAVGNSIPTSTWNNMYAAVGNSIPTGTWNNMYAAVGNSIPNVVIYSPPCETPERPA